MGKSAINARMPEGPYVLVTRTVKIITLCPVSSYQDESQHASGIMPSIDEVRNYEKDMHFADKCEVIDMELASITSEADADRIELTVRVDEANPEYAKEYYRKLGYDVE